MEPREKQEKGKTKIKINHSGQKEASFGDEPESSNPKS